MKSAKANNKYLNLLPFVGAIFALASLLVFSFAPFVQGTIAFQTQSLNGVEVAFGFTREFIAGISTTYIGSPLALVAFLLIIASLLIGLLIGFIPKFPMSKIMLLILSLFLIVASIFCFVSKANFVSLNQNSYDEINIAYGALLSGIFALFSGLSNLLAAFIK